MDKKAPQATITASELANYVVCPEAWRLKYLGRGRQRASERRTEVGKRRDEWVKQQDLSATLRSYAKIAYLLLVAIVIVSFLLDFRRAAQKQVYQSGVAIHTMKPSVDLKTP